MAELTELTATALAQGLRERAFSSREVTQAHLDRIALHDHSLGAFLTVAADSALAEADAAQALIDSGSTGPLTGVPVAIKDNMSTMGIETTCASKILKGYIPPYDATVVAALKAAGMPILGKTNLDEFAMGTSTETSAYKLSHNPWDLDRSPGGSSGGSAASVCGALSPLSLGSDTGGSIRMPASLCGIVGFKPTYGRVSRYGLVAFGSSLDQIGPFGRTVEDVALITEVISGHDPLDSTSLPGAKISCAGVRSGSLKGLKMAVPVEMLGHGTDPAVADVLQKNIDLLRSEGVEIKEISIPTTKLGVTTYYIIAPAEASSNLARFDGVRYGPRSAGKGHIGVVERSRAEGFGPEVKTRIMIGTYALSAGYYDAYYLRAQQVRAIMAEEFRVAFEEFDYVISPTSPIPAFKLGELTDDPMALKLLDYCTIPANMGGFPALSLNGGFARGLPVGLQVMAPVMADERLLQVSYCIEQALGLATQRPPFA